MVVLGLWGAMIGYTVVYAGLANWQGTGISLPNAFLGQGPPVTCKAPPTPPAGGGLGGPSDALLMPQGYGTPYWLGS